MLHLFNRWLVGDVHNRQVVSSFPEKAPLGLFIQQGTLRPFRRHRRTTIHTTPTTHFKV